MTVAAVTVPRYMLSRFGREQSILVPAGILKERRATEAEIRHDGGLSATSVWRRTGTDHCVTLLVLP